MALIVLPVILGAALALGAVHPTYAAPLPGVPQPVASHLVDGIPVGALAPAGRGRVITVAAVGDSVTAWGSHARLKASWAADLSSPPVMLNPTDGWAVPSMRLSDMVAGMQPIHSQVLVIMGGLNDFVSPVTPFATMQAEVDQIVAESGAHDVLLSAVAPATKYRSYVVTWNALLKAHAAAMGWKYVDPWASIRTSGNVYKTGYSSDSVHPTDAASRIVAGRIVAAIEADFGQAN